MAQPNRNSTIGAVIEERDRYLAALREIEPLCHSQTRQHLLAIVRRGLGQ